MARKKKGTLLDDWFADRDGHFVKVRKTGRICWEDNLDTGTSLSDVFIGKKLTKEELMGKAYQLADETIVSMNTPFKVRISVGGSRSGTDSKRLFVGTKHFDDPRLKPGEMADIFVGLTVHEGGHLLYTEFAPVPGDEFTRAVTNILEDERIERRLGQEKPGLVPFIGQVKRYYFDKYYAEMPDKSKLSVVERFVNCLLSIIRYPKDLDLDEVTQFEKYLEQCHAVLTPYPESTAGCKEAAEKIRKIVEKLFEEEEKERKSGSSGKESSSKSSDSDSETEKDGKKGEDSGESKDSGAGSADNAENEEGAESEESAEREESEDKRDDGDEEKGSEDSSGSDSNSAGEDGRTLDEILKTLAESLSEIAEMNGENAESISEAIRNKEVSADVIEHESVRGVGKNVFIHRDIPSERQTYLDDLACIKKYIPLVSRAVTGFSEERSLLFTGLRTGTLDTHRLSQAVQGRPDIYCRKFTQASSRLAICLLVDESGSMYCEDRYIRARQTAILLYEALCRNRNIDLFIYGHTGDMTTMADYNPELGRVWGHSSTDIFAYKEPGGHFDKYRLGAITARDQNYDGVAIYEVARRVRSFTDLPCLMFVISDGEPAYSHGEEHTRINVEKVSKMGFYPIQVCITEEQTPETMFRHYVKYTEMDRFPQELGKLVKRQILKNMKAEINGCR